MTLMPSFSLDTPPTRGESVHSGHNFREVAPEVLSPLTWSIIGPGMERGFRDAADYFGRERVDGPRPQFVSYYGFRPFFNMTSVERLADELPVVDPTDIWELLLGGPSPTHPRSPRPSRMRRLARAPGALGFLKDNGRAFAAAHAELAHAERATMAALSSGSTWALGSACDQAIRAGRTAWALHIRTTSVAFVASAAAKEAFGLAYDDRTALDLLRASAYRAHENASSVRIGDVDIETDRINNYEVADLAEPFARFSSRSLSAAASMLATPSTRTRGTGEAVLEAPYGTALGPVFSKAVAFMGLALGERERSKEVGLRALHCVRMLVDRGAFGPSAEVAGMLGVDELRRISPASAAATADSRREEFDAAAALDYPVDVVHGPKGISPVRRPAPSGLHGRSLAGGWARGVVATESDGEQGVILAGDRVDGNYVLAVLPDGVVSRYGSVLSHVAIVCRELGIPLVANVESPTSLVGQTLTLDGWSGTLEISPTA